MPNPVPPAPFPNLEDLVIDKIKASSLHSTLYATLDTGYIKKPSDKASMKELLERKNQRIKELEKAFNEYQGYLTQDDLMRLINRVATIQNLPKFMPKPRNGYLHKTTFMNALSNYLLEITTKETNDILAD